MIRRAERGQALVETALLLPCLLVLLAGILVAGRTASMVSAAESGAFAQALRDGRRLPDLRAAVARTILPDGDGAVLRTEPPASSRILPAPFPSMEGRTKVRAEVRKDWRDAGNAASWEETRLSRSAEASVDCWDAATPSGKRLKGAIRAYAAARVLY